VNLATKLLVQKKNENSLAFSFFELTLEMRFKSISHPMIWKLA